MIVIGNIDPIALKSKNSEIIYKDTTELLQKCSLYSNFVVSSGCDIPPLTPWENIDAFFKAVEDFYV